VSQTFLSVVIPAYNEAGRISDTLKQVVDFLGTRDYSWEVVVADDGSTDDTASQVMEWARREARVRLVSMPHGGKGWAVKHGMLAAQGRYRFMCDADLSMPIEQVERFLPPRLEEGYHIAIGSREAPGSRRIGEPPLRRLMGKTFGLIVRLSLLPGIRDSQCGFKCLEAEAAASLFSGLRLSGFSFDVELLVLARRRGLRLVEVPIDWYHRPQSKVHPLRDAARMLADVVRLRLHPPR
jgi:glycosyltransferase involved in cell wall biosynthesis